MNPKHSGKPDNPKPYKFVPFAQKVERNDVAGHDQLDLNQNFSGWLTYRLQALTPVFVGDGSYALGNEAGFPQEEVIRPFYRAGGVPTIPGASVKGVARSLTEAISPSCLTTTRVAPGKLPQEVELLQSYRSECGPTHACPACSIFGRMDQLGKARFGDAQPVGGGKLELFRLSPLYAPRAIKSPPVYMTDKKKYKGLKFYLHSQPYEDERQPPVEVIPVGRRVEGRVDFENLSSAELGLLFFALGMDGSIALKLGGGKPLGLGSLRLVFAELALLQADHYLQPEVAETVMSGQDLSQFVDQQVRAAASSKLLEINRASALAEILAYKPDRHAPYGAY